ncbi:MAG: undecaprenyldiphospho-muramoylpentapeptide beta-N-acetylglucosaminyltransferase [Actinomycetota bacterium]|nr:undecaprenyldiphospho-muramoylpentapeptide beta-N-acetylglucosaminyltransferase [Actinomycetota bacterium]
MSTEHRSEQTWAVIAGGGTAGHLMPGLAVARALVARGHDTSSIHFVGASRGLEAELVPDAGFDITLLPGRGIQRRLTLDNVAAIIGLVRALMQAVGLVRRRRPAVVVALGGFASAACALAAVIWRVPLVLMEQNARAGAANRLVARFAKACAVPFPETDLPRTVVTGNPVRDEVLAVAADRDVAAARARLGVDPERTMIVVFAGSLGSRRINEATFAAARALSTRDDLAIRHVVGARDWDDRELIETDGLDYTQVRYEHDMATVLAAADLAVCRSGGTTVAELAVIGVASILVPLPIATRDHQRANAQPLVRAGAAVLVPDDELDAPRLLSEIAAVVDASPIDGRSRARVMSDAARSLGHPDAASDVADLVESNASRPS